MDELNLMCYVGYELFGNERMMLLKVFLHLTSHNFRCVCFVLKRSIGFIQPPQLTESLKPPHAQALLSFYVFAKLYFFGGFCRYRRRGGGQKISIDVKNVIELPSLYPPSPECAYPFDVT